MDGKLMKIITEVNFTKLVPTQKDFLCSIADKNRYEHDLQEEMKKPEEYREPVDPIYMFTEAFIPSSRTLESCQKEFMEINDGEFKL